MSVVGVTAVFLLVHIVAARKWVTDDLDLWQIEQTCRDGARIALINEQTVAAAPLPGQIIDVDVQARLLTRPYADSLLDPASGWFTSTETTADLAFYPLLSGRHHFTETVYQVTPFYADLDDDGSDDLNEDYFLLYTTGVIHWPQMLPVGTAVLFPSNFGTIIEPVADCTLEPLQIGEMVTIDPVHFGADYTAVVSLDPAEPDPFSLVAADDLLYTIETVPAFGELHLDGNTLTAGAVFSRTVLNTGPLLYQQSTPNLTADHFRFQVRATYSGTLTTTMGVNPVDPTISRFGRYQVSAVADHIFVSDNETSCTIRVSEDANGVPGNGVSAVPSISGDGRFIAFQSDASNLVAGDNNGVTDIFVHDRDADGDFDFYADETSCTPGPSRIFRVSIAGDGTAGNDDSTNPLISGNGDFVQFDSLATNLIPGSTSGTLVHYIGFAGQINLTPPHELVLPLVLRP